MLGQIKPEWREKFQKGTGYIAGQFYWLCWIIQNDGQVIMIFDDGDSLTLDRKVFKFDQGV